MKLVLISAFSEMAEGWGVGVDGEIGMTVPLALFGLPLEAYLEDVSFHAQIRQGGVLGLNMSATVLGGTALGIGAGTTAGAANKSMGAEAQAEIGAAVLGTIGATFGVDLMEAVVRPEVMCKALADGGQNTMRMLATELFREFNASAMESIRYELGAQVAADAEFGGGPRTHDDNSRSFTETSWSDKEDGEGANAGNITSRVQHFLSAAMSVGMEMSGSVMVEVFDMVVSPDNPGSIEEGSVALSGRVGDVVKAAGNIGPLAWDGELAAEGEVRAVWRFDGTPNLMPQTIEVNGGQTIGHTGLTMCSSLDPSQAIDADNLKSALAQVDTEVELTVDESVPLVSQLSRNVVAQNEFVSGVDMSATLTLNGSLDATSLHAVAMEMATDNSIGMLDDLKEDIQAVLSGSMPSSGMTPLANEMVAQGWEQGTLHLAARATVGEYEFDIKAGEKLAGTLNAGASLTYQTDVSDQLPGPQETAALLAGFAANKPAPAPTLPVAPVQQLTEHASPNTSEPVLEPPTEVAPKEPSRPTPRRKRGQGTRHNNPNQVSRRQGNPNQVSRRKAKPSRQLGNPNQVSGGNRRR